MKTGFFYVYLFNVVDTNYFKIGRTDHLEKRLCSVNTASPKDIHSPFWAECDKVRFGPKINAIIFAD